MINYDRMTRTEQQADDAAEFIAEWDRAQGRCQICMLRERRTEQIVERAMQDLDTAWGV